jgi:hypothetical protein
MMKYLVLFLLLSVEIPKARSLDDFLTTTLLGQGTEKIEQSYGLNQGALKEIPSYVEVGELQYEGLTFKVNVFFREGACKGYGLWKSQIRNRDKDGRLKHTDNAEIHDVFQVLLRKLAATYGQAPRAKFESRCCGCDSGLLSQSYAWVNMKYALVLMFHDNVSTQSITLRQYRRDEKNGEFIGEDEIAFLDNLYNTRSGKLPDDWPTDEISSTGLPKSDLSSQAAPTQAAPLPHAAPTVQPPPKQSAETKPSPTQREEPTSSTPWSVIVILMGAAIGLACLLLKKRK